MAEDWASDVRKYAPDADAAVIAGIVRHCGIALRSRDAAMVSFADPAELALVRDNFCRRKLGLTDSDEAIDAAIARVGARMAGDTTRNRVTVYYLLADAFGKLGLFGGTVAAAPGSAMDAAELPVMTGPVAAPPPAPAPAPAIAPAAPVMAAPVMAAPAMAAAAAPAAAAFDDGGIVGVGAATIGVLAIAITGVAIVASLMGPQTPTEVPVAAMILPAGASTTNAGLPADVPDGAGVVAQDIAGKPQLSVYFDTASATVTPDFAAAAGAVKAWLDGRPGDRLAVSGYNDPRGDPALNAELSKNRAQQVAAALVALGVPAGAIDLEKPPETTDSAATLENARRVDILIKEGG